MFLQVADVIPLRFWFAGRAVSFSDVSGVFRQPSPKPLHEKPQQIASVPRSLNWTDKNVFATRLIKTIYAVGVITTSRRVEHGEMRVSQDGATEN